MTAPPPNREFGLYGPEFGYPPGGFCLSVFLLVRRGDDVLVGQMREDPRWDAEWAPNLRHYTPERRAHAFGGLRFPAAYLRMGEAPEAAAQRVWRDQLGYAEPLAAQGMRVLSAAGPSGRHPGEQHWDLLFLVETDAAQPPGPLPHWARLDFHARAKLAPDDFVMLHGELVPLVPPR